MKRWMSFAPLRMRWGVWSSDLRSFLTSGTNSSITQDMPVGGMRGRRFPPKVKRSSYSRHARRVDTRRVNALGKIERGAPTTISFSTHENAPEVQLWKLLEGGNKSRQFREMIRRWIVMDSEDPDMMLQEMRKEVEDLTERCTRGIAREHVLRHALGYHADGVVEGCSTCEAWGLI